MSEQLREYLNGRFAPTEEIMSVITELESKKDADYLVEGNIDQDSKMADKTKVTNLRKEYIEAIDSAIHNIGQEEMPETDEFSKVVVYGTLVDSLHKWESRQRIFPEHIQPAISAAVENTGSLSQVLQYWRNPAPFFAVLGDGSARVFQSAGDKNTIVEGSYYGRHSISSFPGIFADLGAGHKVDIKNIQNSYNVSHTGNDSFKIGLYGWDGSNHIKLRDFGNSKYDSYYFLDSKETVTIGDSEQRFALRAAFMYLARQKRVEAKSEAVADESPAKPLKTPVITEPDTDFKQKMTQDIAIGIVKEFRETNLSVNLSATYSARARADIVQRASLARKETILTGKTFTDLEIIIKAAGLNLGDIAEATRNRINGAYETGSVTAYINAMHNDNPKITEFFKFIETKIKP